MRAFDNLRKVKIEKNDFCRFIQIWHMHIDAIPPEELPSDRVLESLFNEQVRNHAGFSEYYREYDAMREPTKTRITDPSRDLRVSMLLDFEKTKL